MLPFISLFYWNLAVQVKLTSKPGDTSEILVESFYKTSKTRSGGPQRISFTSCQLHFSSVHFFQYRSISQKSWWAWHLLAFIPFKSILLRVQKHLSFHARICDPELNVICSHLRMLFWVFVAEAFLTLLAHESLRRLKASARLELSFKKPLAFHLAVRKQFLGWRRDPSRSRLENHTLCQVPACLLESLQFRWLWVRPKCRPQLSAKDATCHGSWRWARVKIR